MDMAQQFHIGQTVRIPWGVADEVEGTVVEVWGDPVQHVRVAVRLDDEEQAVLLLAPSSLTAA